LPAAELEGFLTGLTIAMPRKPGCGAAMGEHRELGRIPNFVFANIYGYFSATRETGAVASCFA